jgi:hypothetical protein
MDEMEWLREDAKLGAEQRDAAVNDLIGLVGAVDGILQAQSKADAGYFMLTAGRPFSSIEAEVIQATMLRAYRWQYIVSGVQDARFNDVLGSMITPQQAERIGAALAPLLG